MPDDETADDLVHLFADQRSALPEEWHDTFDTLVAQGKSPTGITATIEYVTTPKPQREVADEYNVSEVTIRNLQTAVIALGPVESGMECGQSTMVKMDFCNHLADRLGWDEGTEYTVSKSYSTDTPSPQLRKECWRSLFETLCRETDAERGGADDG